MDSSPAEPQGKPKNTGVAAAAAAKSLQSCPTLGDPRDGNPPIPVILQARTLEWVAISSSNAWKWKVKGKSPSRVWLLATPRTAAYQAPPSMGFSRQEYWSGVPSPSPSLKGSPRILEWLAYPFSRGSSRPRNPTRVSCITGRFFTNWAMREDHKWRINFLTCMRVG